MEYVLGGRESIFVCLYWYLKARVVFNVEQTVAHAVMRRGERSRLIPSINLSLSFSLPRYILPFLFYSYTSMPSPCAPARVLGREAGQNDPTDQKQ